jgi:primase-polymerase (primpol)-like protein
MLTGDDPFVGIDLDDCRDPQNGALTPEAQRIIAHLQSYTEVTPSGTGVRIFVRGQLPPEGRVMKNLAGITSLELYDGMPAPDGTPRTHALSVTGQHLEGTPTAIEDRQAELDRLHEEVFGARQARQTVAAVPAPASTPVQSPSLSDTTILEKAQRARNGAGFSRLWHGDTSGYASASEADLALASMLAFYTQDAGQLERILRQSGLWDAKWENRPQYRQDTIQRAIQNRTGTYTGRLPEAVAQPGTPPETAPPPGKLHSEEGLLIPSATGSGGEGPTADATSGIVQQGRGVPHEE